MVAKNYSIEAMREDLRKNRVFAEAAVGQREMNEIHLPERFEESLKRYSQEGKKVLGYLMYLKVGKEIKRDLVVNTYKRDDAGLLKKFFQEYPVFSMLPFSTRSKEREFPERIPLNWDQQSRLVSVSPEYRFLSVGPESLNLYGLEGSELVKSEVKVVRDSKLSRDLEDITNRALDRVRTELESER